MGLLDVFNGNHFVAPISERLSATHNWNRVLVRSIAGGLLSAWPSQFVILALLGGFGFANALGSTLGIPSYVSIGLVVPILAFTTYAGLRILHSIEQYDRMSRRIWWDEEKIWPNIHLPSHPRGSLWNSRCHRCIHFPHWLVGDNHYCLLTGRGSLHRHER